MQFAKPVICSAITSTTEICGDSVLYFNPYSIDEIKNRILMMDSGDIVLDIKEEEKKGLTVEGLLDKFKVGAGKKLDNDRILLSNE